jgi:hypothetical protein
MAVMATRGWTLPELVARLKSNSKNEIPLPERDLLQVQQ